MRSMRWHDGAFRDASPPPRSRPAKWVADSLETIWLAAQDHRLVPVVPGDRFRSRALAYGKPCASQRCMHGLEGGVGTSSSEVFHAYPTATLLRRGSREPYPRNADAPLIEIYFTATRSGFVIKIKIATTPNGKEKTGDSPCRKGAEV